MNWQALWFVLAGLILGFALSTLWEWFYFRRQRLSVKDERVAELERQLRMAEERPRAEQSGGYQSPGVLLESEQAEELSDLAETSDEIAQPMSPSSTYAEDERTFQQEDTLAAIAAPGPAASQPMADDADPQEQPDPAVIEDDVAMSPAPDNIFPIDDDAEAAKMGPNDGSNGPTTGVAAADGDAYETQADMTEADDSRTLVDDHSTDAYESAAESTISIADVLAAGSIAGAASAARDAAENDLLDKTAGAMEDDERSDTGDEDKSRG